MKDINLYEVGDWLVHSSAAGNGDHNAIVYDTTLQVAVRTGLAMINECGPHYKAASCSWWTDDIIKYDGDDPWVVHVRKCKPNEVTSMNDAMIFGKKVAV